MAKEYLTTFEAAKVLGVSPDTVLRWIRGGSLEAGRTLGGHYRIQTRVLQSLVSRKEGNVFSCRPVRGSEYCWQFRERHGEDVLRCKKCLVFRAHAQYCFELAAATATHRPRMVHCQSNCNSCDYYHVSKGSDAKQYQ